MPRKRFIDEPQTPYHLTARTNNRDDFPGADLSYIWKTLCNELYLQQICHNVEVHAFVLMPNHFHLVATSPNRRMDLVMRDFLSSTTRLINTRYRRSGHLFGGRYKWTLVNNPLYYAHLIKYVYRNPVKAGLCTNVGDYSFSTFTCMNGGGLMRIAIHPPKNSLDRFLHRDRTEFEHWLSRPYRTEESEAIRKALKKNRFEYSKSRISSRQPKIATSCKKVPDTIG